MRKNSLLGGLVTTGSSLEGWEIEAHLGLISVHRVAGTGVFSDLFASFSDFFGGRSSSYGKQLEGLYQEATETLQKKAAAMGGNAVIGLNIDFDEISGQGKSMFMLNAVGTAVLARRVEKNRAPTSVGAGDSRLLSPLEMDVLNQRREILTDISENRLRFTDEVWTFATENRLSEVAPQVLGAFANTFVQGANDDAVKRRAFAYFSSIDPAEATQFLYKKLVSGQGDQSEPGV